MTTRESSQSAAGIAARATRALVSILALLAAISAAGCLGPQIEENKRQLEAQQAELEKLNGEVAALQQPQGSYVVASAGSCDMDVMRKATQRGGEAFAHNKFKEALGYYQDAQTACPGNAEAELNSARAYEALGERDAAVSNYTQAANAGIGADPAIVKQARDALARLKAAP